MNQANVAQPTSRNWAFEIFGGAMFILGIAFLYVMHIEYDRIHDIADRTVMNTAVRNNVLNVALTLDGRPPAADMQFGLTYYYYDRGTRSSDVWYQVGQDGKVSISLENYDPDAYTGLIRYNGNFFMSVNQYLSEFHLPDEETYQQYSQLRAFSRANFYCMVTDGTLVLRLGNKLGPSFLSRMQFRRFDWSKAEPEITQYAIRDNGSVAIPISDIPRDDVQFDAIYSADDGSLHIRTATIRISTCLVQ